MSNLEQLTHYAVTIKNKDIAFERTLLDREEAGKIIEGIEENHKKELEGKENEIKQLKGELENTKTSLQEAQETLEQERSKYESNLKEAQKTLEQEMSKYKSEKEEWEMKKKELKAENEALKDEKERLEHTIKQEEEEHTQTQEKLQVLQKDAKKDLYELYKQICPVKDNYGIQGENLYTFLITSGQVEILENIVESVKQSAINNPEQFSKEKELFNQLFDSMQGCYNLERIVAKVGDNYDENYYKVEGDSVGKISEVILDGFKRNGNRRTKPLVKVKK